MAKKVKRPIAKDKPAAKKKVILKPSKDKKKAAKAVPKKEIVKPVRSAKSINIQKSASAGIQDKNNPFSFPDDIRIEEKKFYTGVFEPVAYKPSLAELEERRLQVDYQEDMIVLMARDPHWAYCFWDVCRQTLDRLKSEYPNELNAARWILRSYDVSYIDFNGSNAHRFFDTPIGLGVKNWYLNFGSPGTSWCIDLGFILSDGRFVLVARSNTISFPLEGPSGITDEEWMIPDDEFRRLYGLSIGLGPNMTSPVGRLWQERLKKDVTSGGLASMGASPVKKPLEIPFWLVVDAELIVYGATEPDAKVTVQGKPINLRKDGTFILRFALPDGKQVIPVEGTSAKTGEKRVITPVVTRSTTRVP